MTKAQVAPGKKAGAPSAAVALPLRSAGRDADGRDLTSRTGLLGAQSVLGNRQVVSLLAAGHSLSRPPAAGLRRTSRSGGQRVQRLVDRAGLEAKAGQAKGNIGLKKMSVQYKAVLSKLDAYHAESDRLWQARTAGALYADTLRPLLDDLALAALAYVGDREESTRAPHLKELALTDIPSERRRLKAVAAQTDFTEMDRAAPVSDVGSGRPATFGAAGIEVGYEDVYDQAELGQAQCHAMTLWMEVDAGNRPARSPGDDPDSVYGVTLEYWEQVRVHYNFIEPDNAKVAGLKLAGEGATLKAWNDIKAMEPTSPTFTKVANPIDLSWMDAVRQSRTLQLRGKKKIGFKDLPGVTPLPGKYIKRTLNFRIVMKDGTKRREIFATQVIECDGHGQYPALMTYADSLGTSTGRTRPADQPQMADMAANAALLPAAPQVVAGDVSAAVPGAARTGIRPFVAALLTGKAPRFKNRELTAVQAKFPDAADLTGPYTKYARLGKKKYNTADDYYEIAGMNSAPYPVAGYDYFEHPLGANGLLMAMTKGGQILRMYHTNNVARKVGAKQVRVRSFSEIPIEEVVPYVETERKLVGVSDRNATQYAALVTKRQTDAAALQVAINNAVVKSTKPRRRDVRKLLEDNPRDYERIEKMYDAAAGADTVLALLKSWYTDQMAGQTLDSALYERLTKPFPHERAIVALKEAWMAEAARLEPTKSAGQLSGAFLNLLIAHRAEVGAAPGLAAAVAGVQGNVAATKAAVMTYARRHKAEQATLEKVYNNANPANNPPTVGELISEHFVDLFKGSGSLLTFRRAMDNYPGLEYRLRPAYRMVHGDKALRKMLDLYQSASVAADIPDPGAAANLAAKAAFRAHGPFDEMNFASSVAPVAKFDATYDPATSELKVVLKLSFTFDDATEQPAKIKGKEVGRQFANQTWTNTGKAKYKADFRAAVRDTWEANAPVIRCTRPGWEDVVARPVFDIVEVAVGQGHNPVHVRKTVLQDNGGTKKLSGLNSGWGATATNLKETDVAEKISDPAVHHYLHAIERRASSDPAYVADRRQLEQRLRDYGTLKFIAGSDQLDRKRADILIGEIGRLQTSPELAKLHPLEVAAPTLAGTDSQRVDRVAARLSAKGVSNPITKLADATVGADTVVVRTAPIQPTVQDTYIKNWSRITAAHEFGHMLGLMDEYYAAKSGDTVKKMISDGVLPAGTRSDHLVANPPVNSADEAPGQAATAVLADQAGLAGADYTLADGTMSSSIMTGGYELWPQHYLTVWEALGHLTAADLGKRFWRIG